MSELLGKVAVVTGASTGVGRAMALELARAGADVAVHCRAKLDAARDVARQIHDLGRESTVLVADLGEAATHEPLVEDAWNWRGAVDVWINNAGVDVLTGANRHLSFDEKLDLLWRVDVVGTMHLSRSVGARMRQRVARGEAERGASSVLTVGWDQVEHGMGGESGEMFTAVKGAVMAFSRSLARSLAPDVRVNCLALGWIRTAWGAEASEYWQQRAVNESLLARWGLPEDVARAARFLASPASGFITGAVLPINGGFRFHAD